MYRKTTWRNKVSDAVSFHQDQALNTTIFLLKSFGPTGFVLREEGQIRNLKVCLGDPHTCTCPVFIREKEPCKHICWVLLRKFRLPREHEYSFQPGLVERQILELLHGLHQTTAHRMENDPSPASGTPSQPNTDQEAGSVRRKAIQAQDVCPICQEELLEKKLPVCYCRFGCGNNVHISCMKVWADHQKLSDKEDTVKCPLCREHFSSLKLLQEQVKNTAKLLTAAEREKPEKHLGVLCNSCLICPIIGKCFKCTVCKYFHLCEDCTRKGCHHQHRLAPRTGRKEKWLLVGEDLRDGSSGVNTLGINDSSIPAFADPLPEDVLASLPAVRVRPGSWLLHEGLQCRICLQEFKLHQHVRTLPCHHKLHSDCVDRILLKTNSCPLDGFVIYNPLTWRSSEKKTPAKSPAQAFSVKPGGNNLKDLFVPGVVFQNLGSRVSPSHGSLNVEASADSLVTSNAKQRVRKSELQRKLTADSSSSVSHQSNSCTLVPNPKSSQGSPNKCPAVTQPGGKPQLNLFVGSHKPEPEHTAAAAAPARRNRLQPKKSVRTNITDTKGQISGLRMIGVPLSSLQQQQTET